MAERGGAGDEGGAGKELIVGRKNRPLQLAKARKDGFGVKRQEAFLAMLAATCNVQRSCAAAGVTDSCVYMARRRDPLFREAWNEALGTGLARIEAMLIERAAATKPPQVDHGIALPPEPLDVELAKHLLREHSRSLAGTKAPRPVPPAAEWSQVEDYFIGKLRALDQRLKTKRAAEAGVVPPPPPTAAASSAGVPPAHLARPLPRKTGGGEG
ncbi:MAG: hypothetical protein M3Q83_01625 [Pseudomonadota bacterium]|nr:hypothetical protein [Pseudomonadota bacterium]